MILTSNRVNQPISNYIKDNRINNLIDDPNAFVYAIKPVELKDGATSIKIHLEGHVNVTSDLRRGCQNRQSQTRRLQWWVCQCGRAN